MICPICSWSLDNQDYLLIQELQYWRVCLAPNQSLLGRCVIHLKRHVGDLANLRENELLEFLSVITRLEEAIRFAFGATMFNWSCYMNHAYRESPPNPHVHWWAVPRYDHAVRFEDTFFEDPHFASPYDHYRVMDAPSDLRLKIAEAIKSHLLFLEKKTI